MLLACFDGDDDDDDTVNKDIITGRNHKIVAIEKTTWFHFRLKKTSFLFLLQTI